jgi:predicted lipid-binding transport protein (Tim44 family)
MKQYKNNKPIFPKSTNPNARTSPSSPPKQVPPAHVPQSTYSNTGESMIGGIMSSVIQGAALGTGSQLASRGIDAIIGPRKIETVVSTLGSDDNNCLKDQDAYISCMHKGDTEQCKNIFEMLSKCKNINI